MSKHPVKAGAEARSVYQMVFDDNPLGIVFSDSEGVIRQANPEFERMLGYSQEDLLGKAWVDITHPADQATSLANLAAFRKDEVRHLTIRKRYVAKGGQTVWARVTISTVFTWGLRTGFVHMVEDITEQVRMETALAEKQRLLAKVLASAPIVMFACDLNGVVTVCEGATLNDGGLGDYQLVGRSIWDVAEDPTSMKMHFAAALAGESGTVAERLGGKVYEYHYDPVFDDSGSVLGVTAVALDISDREIAIEENRQLSHFIASLSHELRNPLNTVIGFNELLSAERAGKLTEKQKHYVGCVDHGGRLLLNLINDVLDLSKIKAGQMTIDPEPVDALSAASNALVQMGPQATNKALDLSVEDPGSERRPDAGGRLQMVVDSRRLHQILLNLLSNAIKFTPAGGSVRVAVTRDESGWTSFAVSDTGCGIAGDQLESIFDEYRQLGQAAGRAHEGTGLGLALSRHFARLMGGTLTVESTVGEGSKFTVSLPTVSGTPIPTRVDAVRP